MTRASGQTNKTHTVKLPSALERVQWRQSTAVPGAAAGLDIQTRFVGNGAEIEIALSDHNGRSHGTFKDKLHGNRFTAGITVPIKASGALYADVKLPRHGLSMKSDALLLMPPIEITNAMWSQKAARRGDVLTLSADVKGAPDGADGEITIWEYDDKGAHDLITRFPVLVAGEKVEAEWEFLFADDTGHIPAHDERQEGYVAPRFFFRVSAGGAASDSSVLTFNDWIHITVSEESGLPLSGIQYHIRFADGTERRGLLGDDGNAQEEGIPPGPYFVSFPDIGEGVTIRSIDGES